MIFIVLLIVKLIDPLLILFALVGGVLSRGWRHVAATAVIVAVIIEVLLANFGGYRFDPVALAMGALAAGIWATIAFLIKRRVMASKRDQNSAPPSSETSSKVPSSPP